MNGVMWNKDNEYGILPKNEMRLSFSAASVNEGLARTAAAYFVSGLNPTVAEIMEIKTAVSEAVTNAIIHGYENKGFDKLVQLYCRLTGRELYIEVSDEGVGISNIAEAMTPLYTSKPELERSGMGFSVMETFMDSVNVTSSPGMGTVVSMSKNIGQ